MGSLTNSLFSLLLGWMRGTAQWLWQAINSPDGSGLLMWLGEHWLMLAIVLCTIGIAIDLTVYFFRWRPLDVWRSYFRRRKMRQYSEEQQVRRWVYADGTARVERVSAEEMPQRPLEPAAYLDNSLFPEVDPQAEPAAEEQSQVHQPRRRRAGRNKRKGVLAMLLGDDEEQKLIAYRPANQVTDKSQHFNTPYYPQQRKRSDDDDQ